MERTMRKVTKHGIEWLYRPNVIYTAAYRGWTIKVQRVAGMDWMKRSGPKRTWRLFVTRGAGGSIAFHHQFYVTLNEAQQTGMKLVDEHPATLKSA